MHGKLYMAIRNWVLHQNFASVFIAVVAVALGSSMLISYATYLLISANFESPASLAIAISFVTALCVAPPMIWFSIANLKELLHAHIELASTKSKLDERVEELARSELELRRARDVLETRVAARTRELERARARSDDANAIKSRFLANMSHELRTPLNAIIGFSSMIQQREELMGGMSPEQLNEYSGLIVRSAEHLHSLVNDVLDLSRIEAGRCEIARELLPLRQSCADAVAGISVTAEARGQRITLEVPSEDAVVFADRRALHQILTNLIANALKFSSNDAQICVKASQNERGAEIIVTDRGCGMSRIQVERATIPFETISNTDAAKGGGTGLGLSIVEALVKQHGGRLEIESALQRGTSVRICLPEPEPATIQRRIAI